MEAAKIVSEYYGKTLQKTSDLKTNACCTAKPPSEALRPLLSNINDEVTSKYYGCGFPIPDMLTGMKVLDLGCGSGRDCFLLSQLVGPTGFVVGVDMTEEQLAVAERNVAWHMNRFGFEKPNVQFKLGLIEKLDELDLEPESFDIVVSNCVVNLSSDKEAVLKQAYRLLKNGGEFYFSDVYSDRRVPAALKADAVLWSECLSGALYWNDFLSLAKRSGFVDPRLVSDSRITISNREVESKIGHISFFSATYRLWKIAELEEGSEDYGQSVVYLGTIPDSPQAVKLDGRCVIPTGKNFPVSGNTFRMLNQTRYAPHFTFFGNWEVHFGLFEGSGGGIIPFDSASTCRGSCTSSCC